MERERAGLWICISRVLAKTDVAFLFVFSSSDLSPPLTFLPLLAFFLFPVLIFLCARDIQKTSCAAAWRFLGPMLVSCRSVMKSAIPPQYLVAASAWRSAGWSRQSGRSCRAFVTKPRRRWNFSTYHAISLQYPWNILFFDVFETPSGNWSNLHISSFSRGTSLLTLQSFLVSNGLQAPPWCLDVFSTLFNLLPFVQASPFPAVASDARLWLYLFLASRFVWPPFCELYRQRSLL